MIALLLWANVTGSPCCGLAVAAQVEALRAGRPQPLLADSDDDGIPMARPTPPSADHLRATSSSADATASHHVGPCRVPQ